MHKCHPRFLREVLNCFEFQIADIRRRPLGVDIETFVVAP